MNLLIGIATYQRIEKLKKLLESLRQQTFQNFVVVICADNKDFATKHYIDSLQEVALGQIHCVVQPETSYVIGNWNRIIKEYFNIPHIHPSAFLGLVDDIILAPNAIENAVNALNSQFPDGDGVIGFKQVCAGHENYTFKWFGQCLFGRKFIERYKQVDYKICCPDYFHFVQDREMFDYASSLNKFYCCNNAILDHNHPSFTGEVDSTHYITREKITPPMGSGPSLRRSVSLLEKDFQMEKVRISRGYLWGKDFNLVGKSYA